MYVCHRTYLSDVVELESAVLHHVRIHAAVDLLLVVFHLVLAVVLHVAVCVFATEAIGLNSFSLSKNTVVAITANYDKLR